MTDPGSRRRAKIKLLAKKSIETGEDCDAIPDSYRHYLTMQAMDSGKAFIARGPGSMASYSSGGMFVGADHSSPQKVGKFIQ